MPERKDLETCEPNFETWPALVKENVAQRAANSSEVVMQELRETRNEVVSAALSFEHELAALARDVKLEWREPTSAQRNVAETAFCAAGHQPIIYHPGISAKTDRLTELVRAVNGVGLNVVLDTDDESCGRLLFPKVLNNSLALGEAQIASTENLALNQRVKSVPELDEIFSEIESGLADLELLLALTQVKRAHALYAKLSGIPAVLANSLVRLSFSPAREYFEIPLSSIVKLNSVKTIFSKWLAAGEDLKLSYNSTLEAHRALHKIKNPANPFPNLSQKGDRYELPFWVLDRENDERAHLWLEPGAEGLAANGNLVPRGALITVLFRCFLSDFFIHGLGGAKYDTFTDELIKSFIGLPPGHYAVVSASRYLFETQIEHYEEDLRRESKFKEITNHPQKFVGQGLFEAALEQQLIDLAAQRVELAKSGRGKDAVLLNQQIRDLVENSPLFTRIRLSKPSESSLSAWYCREYPFFFF